MNGSARSISASSWLLRAIVAALALSVCFLGVQPAASASGTAGQPGTGLGYFPRQLLSLDVNHSLTLQQINQDPYDLMLPGPVGDLPVVDDGRWSSNLTGNSLVATLWWIFLLFMLFAAGMPWARMIFRESSWAAGHARLIALLISGYLVWVLSSFEFIRFRAVWSALALVLVGAAGWLLLRRTNRIAIRSISFRSSLLGPEIAFWAVFGLFLAFRWVNPDSWHPTWGGEKPMEFAHINAILRSAHFPPYDPWFSDGLLNYYYYGEYLIAYLMKLSGIPSEIAFNLAQPTVIAILASGVYSVTATLASRLSGQQARAWIGGATGVVIVVLMGNLVALRNVLEALPSLPSPSFLDWTWAGSRAIPTGITEFPYFTGLYADLHAHVVALPVTVLVIAIGLELALRSDLPVASSLKAPVAGSVPLLGAAALALGTLGAANAWDAPLYAALIAASVWTYVQPGRTVPVSFGLTAALTAVVFALAYVLFKPFHDYFTALYSSIEQVPNPTDTSDFLLHLGGLIALIGIGYAAFAILNPGRSRTSTRSNTVAIAIFTAAISIGIIVYGWRELPDQPESDLVSGIAAILAASMLTWFIDVRFGRKPVLTLATILAFGAVIGLTVNGWPVLAIGVGVALCGSVLWLSPSEHSRRFLGLLIAAGGFAIAGVEIAFLVDDLASTDFYRMNTIFKIYNEIWIVLGVVAGAFSGALAVGLLASSPQGSTSDAYPPVSMGTTRGTGEQSLRFLLACSAGVIVLAGLLYPLLATRPRLDLRFPGHPGPTTLNALGWMDYGTIQAASGETIAFVDDREVIDWFNAEVDGSPVIAEASIGPYRGNGSRISIATGLPTVLGWDRHERQQRYAPEINARLADLTELYNSTDPARQLELLNKYNVEYVIVGEVERKTILPGSNIRPYASDAGLLVFESMVGDSLEIAFQSGETVVYRLVRDPD